jgi:HEPN domain-containing protein
VSREVDARAWMEYAEADRRSARNAMAAADYRDVAFHCHQAAEKALKAVTAYGAGIPMGSRSTSVADQVERFVAQLNRALKVERVILFGSHAYGRPHEWSDIDVAVVSSAFAGLGRVARLEWLERVAWEAETHAVEPVGFTWEEYVKSSDLSLLGEVRDKGIVVYDAAHPERTPAMALREQRVEYRPEEDS